VTLCIYAIIKRFFKSLYKIIELICNNIWIIQNSVVYLYYQRNTNTLLINKLNSNIMTIIATRDFQKAVFTWNEDLDECNHTALGISHKEMDTLIENKVHEGVSFKNWNIEIKY